MEPTPGGSSNRLADVTARKIEALEKEPQKTATDIAEIKARLAAVEAKIAKPS
jgi:flagellar motility protein MotE (MotC chaperone)